MYLFSYCLRFFGQGFVNTNYIECVYALKHSVFLIYLNFVNILVSQPLTNLLCDVFFFLVYSFMCHVTSFFAPCFYGALVEVFTAVVLYKVCTVYKEHHLKIFRILEKSGPFENKQTGAVFPIYLINLENS